MKKFHVFVWPYIHGGVTCSVNDYYIGSFEDIDTAKTNAKLSRDAYCEILETLSDGSLQLTHFAFELREQWVWSIEPHSELSGDQT